MIIRFFLSSMAESIPPLVIVRYRFAGANAASRFNTVKDIVRNVPGGEEKQLTAKARDFNGSVSTVKWFLAFVSDCK